MLLRLQYLPAGLAMILCTVVFVAFSVLLALFFSSIRSPAWKDAFRSLHPPLCGSLMVAFSIFAVIVANTSWKDQEEAHRTARSEAFALKRLLYHMPDNSQGLDLLRDYITSAINEEWPRMAEGRRGHPGTTAALVALREWGLAPDVPYINDNQRQFFQDALHDLGMTRDKRLTLTRATIPIIIWLALLGSASIVILSVVMAHAHSRRGAIIISTLYGSIMGAILSALLMLDHPFAGSVAVTAHHLEDVLSRF